MYRVFVVGFEPEFQYVEANCFFDTLAEAQAFARRYTSDYVVSITNTHTEEW